MEIEELKPCPFCKSSDLLDAYVYIRCNRCLMEGPKANGGKNDDHADQADHRNAVEMWNKLPRR